jgi:hypothetical protein
VDLEANNLADWRTSTLDDERAGKKAGQRELDTIKALPV